jgi:hypothetical protein
MFLGAASVLEEIPNMIAATIINSIRFLVLLVCIKTITLRTTSYLKNLEMIFRIKLMSTLIINIEVKGMKNVVLPL